MLQIIANEEACMLLMLTNALLNVTRYKFKYQLTVVCLYLLISCVK